MFKRIDLLDDRAQRIVPLVGGVCVAFQIFFRLRPVRWRQRCAELACFAQRLPGECKCLMPQTARLIIVSEQLPAAVMTGVLGAQSPERVIALKRNVCLSCLLR